MSIGSTFSSPFAPPVTLPAPKRNWSPFVAIV
jgi:hypothetical protein